MELGEQCQTCGNDFDPMRPCRCGSGVDAGMNDFTCVARKQGTAGGNDPADCDWPFCGCDVRATKGVEALQKSGWLSPNEKNDYARKVREQAFREAAAEQAE